MADGVFAGAAPQIEVFTPPDAQLATKFTSFDELHLAFTDALAIRTAC
jgi:hypothetical protein